ncbi:unnamed protein product, partial [Sphacelaria rigidula]
MGRDAWMLSSALPVELGNVTVARMTALLFSPSLRDDTAHSLLALDSRRSRDTQIATTRHRNVLLETIMARMMSNEVRPEVMAPTFPPTMPWRSPLPQWTSRIITFGDW